MADFLTPAELSLIVSAVNVARYVLVAAGMSLIYDYVLTIEDEIRLVWYKQLSTVKILFFLNRFLAFLILIVDFAFLFGGASDDSSCSRLLITIGILTVVIFLVDETMLFMRVYAIWALNKVVLVILAALLVTSFTGVAYLAIKATLGAQMLYFVIPTGHACVISSINSDIWIVFTIVPITEAVMLVLIVLRAFLGFGREEGHVFSKGYRLVVKDGIGYFLCILLISLVNILIMLVAPFLERTIFVVIHSSLQTIICARLLLRLRGAYDELERASSVPTLSTWMARSNRGASQNEDTIFVVSSTEVA